MAEKMAFVEQFLNCHVCLETFSDPVSLSCHHSFCSSCLQDFWDEVKNKNCPLCERKSSKDSPNHNFLLKELADSYRAASTDQPVEAEAVCCEPTHDLKGFSEEEQRSESPDLVPPMEQGVSKPKEQSLKPDLTSQEEELTLFRELEKTYDDMGRHCKTQLVDTERRIRAEFDTLRRFLAEEEEARVAALREEGARRRKAIAVEMRSIRTQICALSESDGEPTGTRGPLTSRPPQVLPGALVDVAKHLGNLGFRVWEKMRDRVHFTPVTLDPNTASGWLCLSDDLTGVRAADVDMALHPENPERFTLYSNVLGSEGLVSGVHSWEVEVGDHPDWAIGVTKGSADRKGARHASPKYGVWCLLHRGVKYTNGSGKRLPLKRAPRRVRIQLDCDRGEVSFYDPQGMALICAHRDTFAEKVYPYFCVGPAGEAQSTGIKVCDVSAVSSSPRHVSLSPV